jgi:predicted HNH restriction endonuclease
MTKRYRDVKAWREKNKAKVVQAFGGKCAICGLVDDPVVYDLHHVDPKEKELRISGKIMSWEKTVNEAKKCSLICSNCHRKLHKGYICLPEDYQKFDETLITL